MGRVMSVMNITADGFVDARYTVADSEFYDFNEHLLEDVTTIAFGRHTFELFQDRWPLILKKENVTVSQAKMAQTLYDKHKLVYSSTLKETSWNNSTIAREINVEQINGYKENGSGGLLVLGSPAVVASLTAMNLIDDYYFFIQPLIAGSGVARLFDKLKLDKSLALNFVESKRLTSGVQVMHYKSVR